MMGDENEKSAQIIEVAFSGDVKGIDRERYKIKRKEYGAGKCYRHQYVIDEESRTVSCGRCDKQLDAIDALLDMVRSWERDWVALRMARDEAERVLDEAKRERKNAKAARRRAEKKQGD